MPHRIENIVKIATARYSYINVRAGRNVFDAYQHVWPPQADESLSARERRLTRSQIRR
jgi:hypothetical protein